MPSAGIILMVVLAGWGLIPQARSAEFALDFKQAPPAQIKVGDQLIFEVKEAPAGTSSLVPPSAGSDSSSSDRTENEASPPGASPIKSPEEYFRESGFERITSQGGTLAIVALRAGKLSVPPLQILGRDEEILGVTRPFGIEVSSSITASDVEEKVNEKLKPPVGVDFPWVLIIALAVLVLAAVGFVIGWIVRRSRNRKAVLPSLPERTADAVALGRLKELESLRLPEKGAFKQYYFGISEVLKQYVGARFKFDAAESTSSEVLDHLRASRPVSDQVLDQLESIFHRLDRVKFTDFVPSAPEALHLLKEARDWIVLTRGRVEPEVKPNAV